jgi:hypothetical protein
MRPDTFSKRDFEQLQSAGVAELADNPTLQALRDCFRVAGNTPEAELAIRFLASNSQITACRDRKFIAPNQILEASATFLGGDSR